MSGFTKKLYKNELFDIKVMWKKQLKAIEPLLPQRYTKRDIIDLLKEFFPHEWDSVEIKKQYYDWKDKGLKNQGIKPRYKMPTAEKLLTEVPKFKHIMSYTTRKNWALNFDEEKQACARKTLSAKRQPKIEKINHKIEVAKSKVQLVTPRYLDKLIGLYERKNATQKDRHYIIQELMKYYTPKITKFFFKVNDTELNFELREIAFKHLQSFNYAPRLRKQKYMICHAGNKKRKKYLKYEYAKEKTDLDLTPQGLAYRIKNSKEQQLKDYDFFISHSSKDRESVQKLITYENECNKDIFCDWINDSDYLKRNLVCEETLEIIEIRLRQSRALIFVDSKNSQESVWCKYEINYFNELNKPIYILSQSDIENGVFNLKNMNVKPYIDTNYKKLALYERRKIKG